MASVWPSAVAAAAALLGVLIPLTFSFFRERGRAAELRQFRNHDKRRAVAEDYLRAVAGFRRAVRDYASAAGETAAPARATMIDAARAADDAAQLLRLYFTPQTAAAENDARDAVVALQQRARYMQEHQARWQDDQPWRDREWKTFNDLDKSVKALRDQLISGMKPQLGEDPAPR